MADVLIIKKYPNRRLYDTSSSRYITLDDVRTLVMKHQPFKVIDARSEEDMTNYVLLQIITEEEAGKFPLFTTELLQNIIRYYGNPLQKNMTEFMERGFSFFNEKFKPETSFGDSLKQNMDLWQNTFENMFNTFQNNLKSSPKPATKKKKSEKKQ